MDALSVLFLYKDININKKEADVRCDKIREIIESWPRKSEKIFWDNPTHSNSGMFPILFKELKSTNGKGVFYFEVFIDPKTSNKDLHINFVRVDKKIKKMLVSKKKGAFCRKRKELHSKVCLN